MNGVLKKIIPRPATTLSLFILPFVLSVYFLVTKYSDKFIVTTEINYFDVQDNVLEMFFLQQAWKDYLARIMDFAFWGVLASLAILIWWCVSIAKTSVENHNIQSGFTNFQISKEKWHGSFIMVATIKIILIFVMAYSLFTLIARAVPLLALGIANSIQQLSTEHLLQAVYGALLIVGLQALFIMCLKLFKITRAD